MRRARSKQAQRAAILAAIGAALAVHLAIAGTANVLDLHIGVWGLPGGGAIADEPDLADLEPSCMGDALLSASASAAICLAPWNSDVEACTYDVKMSYLLQSSGCYDTHPETNTQVSVVSPNAAEKFKPIDPEPLIAELLEQEKQKPPPVVPLPQPQPQPQPKQAPPPPPPPQRPTQVVETVKPKEEKAPDNTRLMSEYDISVDKQNVNRGARNEPLVAKAKPEELSPKIKPKDEEPSVKKLEPDRPPGRDQRAPDVPGSLAMRKPGAQNPAQTQQEAQTKGSATGGAGPVAMDGYSPRKGTAAFEQERRDRAEQPKGQNGAGGGAPQVPNLKPSQDVLERAIGGGSVDHLEDVENGDETALSSKRWIYASFFNRLKRQVAQNWDPATVWRRSDPNGTVYGFKTRVTEVRVALSKKGELTKIVVTTPSGVTELDEEAVRAFHAAAPFPNPPEGLVAKDNLITFAFSFYFEIGSPHTSWRVIRSM